MEYTLLEDSNCSINNYFIDKLKQSHPDISYSRLLVSYWFHKIMNDLNTLHFNNISLISGSLVSFVRLFLMEINLP